MIFICMYLQTKYKWTAKKNFKGYEDMFLKYLMKKQENHFVVLTLFNC